MIRRPPRSTLDRSSAASDVYKRQDEDGTNRIALYFDTANIEDNTSFYQEFKLSGQSLSLIHISEPTRPY